MDDITDSLRTLFTAPICPHCAALFDAAQYDDVDDCAYCSNCGRPYKIDAEHRPPHPGDRQEHCLFDTEATVALDQFRTDTERIAAATIRETAGASYELYARRFREAFEPYIDALDPVLQDRAIAIANHHGYVEGAVEAETGFGPGLCAISGIDEDHCHCGRHP